SARARTGETYLVTRCVVLLIGRSYGWPTGISMTDFIAGRICVLAVALGFSIARHEIRQRLPRNSGFPWEPFPWDTFPGTAGVPPANCPDAGGTPAVPGAVSPSRRGGYRQPGDG